MASKGFIGYLHLLVSITLQLQLSFGSPIGPAQRRQALEGIGGLKKGQNGAFFSVLGIGALGDGSIHPRLEIRQLEQDIDQWNVYLLGLQRFQSMSQSDKLSYYQIAGIHGRPYIGWDGVEMATGGWGGFCQHGSNIFPTWHRPYLALFEEVLYLNAREVVSEMSPGPLKDRYTATLVSFRMPYWDWAAVPASGQGALPISLQSPTVEVMLPNGTTTIPNPLFDYKFHPLSANDMGGGKFSTWPSTIRHPTSNHADSVSQNHLAAAELDFIRPNIQSRVFNMLSMQQEYTNISNDGIPGDSFESIHDIIHNTVGGGGHMSEVAYSAFDPIFFLHHTNIDRLFAIWQKLNPGNYVTPKPQPFITFVTVAGQIMDAYSDLSPFHRSDAGNFWTSESCRSTKAFAYTYPELVDLAGNNDSTLISRINNLYSLTATAPQKRDSPETSNELIERNPLHPHRVAGAASFSSGRQYTANIKVHKFGLDESFNVYVFLGDEPSPEAANWSRDPSFVGVSGIFAARNADPMKTGSEANGVVPLTAALEAKLRGSELGSLKEDVVGGFLKKNLKWRISTVSGKEIAVENVPGFQLSILWSKVEPATSVSEFPRLVGDSCVLLEATDGLPGGFSKGDLR